MMNSFMWSIFHWSSPFSVLKEMLLNIVAKISLQKSHCKNNIGDTGWISFQYWRGECRKNTYLRFSVSRSFQILILWRLQQQQQQGEEVEDGWTWNVPLNWKFVFTLGVHFTVLWQPLPCYRSRSLDLEMGLQKYARTAAVPSHRLGAWKITFTR